MFCTAVVDDGFVNVSFEAVWSSFLSEFPPSYRVLISYDPDIFIDGNDFNDDCSIESSCVRA